MALSADETPVDPAFPEGAACRIDGAAPYRTIAEIPVGLDPEGVAVDVRRRRAYVACSRSDLVSVVDLEKLEAICDVAVGAEPIDLVYDEATDRLIVDEVFTRRIDPKSPTYPLVPFLSNTTRIVWLPAASARFGMLTVV